MSNPLFDAFHPVSAKQWKQHIQFDLDGLDYNANLVWMSMEGIQIKPFYHADDMRDVTHNITSPTQTFKVCETVKVTHSEKANRAIKNAISGGAEVLRLILITPSISLNDVLKDIALETVILHLDYQFLNEDTTPKTLSLLNKAKQWCNISDCIGHLGKTGNWYKNMNVDLQAFSKFATHQKCFAVNMSNYANAGANNVQQLAYGLAHTNEYFNLLETANTDTNTTVPTTVIYTVAVGSNYFFEIAKLKALQWLFDSISSAYNTPYNCHIVAIPTTRNKTLYDAHTNIVRSTTECMSAILGGAQTINNLPYDAIYKHPNAFSQRIARNQLHILKHESHFDMVSNPTNGSYYIETLTKQLAEKALERFKTIETSGGFLKQLKAGTIQRKIKDNAKKEVSLFNAEVIKSVGTNTYINPEEHIDTTFEVYPFVEKKKRKTLIAPIVAKRLSEHIEQKRLKTPNT